MLYPTVIQATNMGTITLNVGETKTVYAENNSYYTVSGSWSITGGSSFSFASKSQRSCTIRGVKAGTATLNWMGYSNAVYDEMYWTVNVTEVPIIKVSSITLNTSSLSLKVRQKETLEAIVRPSDATDKSVTWSINNPNVATIGPWGNVEAKAEGNAIITCKANDGSGVSATCTLKVEGELPEPESSSIIQIATGLRCTMILMSDGSLWSWGNNEYGQLCDGTTTNRSKPQKVMTDVAFVACGAGHTLIVKEDGTLWACGWNYRGQLGDGTNTNCSTPKYIMSDVASVSAGYWHTAILKTDGSLWTCGYNEYGALGDGTTTHRSTPKKIMTGVKTMSAGMWHTMIVKNDGSLWGCGYWQYGALAGVVRDNANVYVSTPKQAMTGVKAVTAGYNRTFVVKQDGTLWACGNGGYGSLGTGSTALSNYTPAQVMSGVATVSSSSDHAAILKTNGTLWTCGWNYQGQLGDGTTTDSSTPKQVMTGVTTVAAGGFHTVILKTDGTLWASGMNNLGQLGDGTTTNRYKPVQIEIGIRVTSIVLNQTSLKLQIGQGETLKATIMPTNATNKSVTWSSSNTSVATVSSTGLVTAKAAGTATITCKANDGNGKSATCTVTVTAPVEDPSISFVSVTSSNTNLLNLTQNDKLKFSATFKITGKTAKIRTVLAILDKETMSFKFRGEEDSREFPKDQQVTINYEYALTNVPAGDYYATVLYFRDWGDSDTHSWYYKNEASLKDITVKATSIPITKITLSASSSSLNVGDTKQLAATITPSNATNKAVTWSSSNTSVATISSTGFVTAKAAGSATITCKANDGSGVSATCKVTVTAPNVESNNYIYVDNVESTAGNQLTLSLKMKNKVKIRGFQFDLYLPTGVTAVKNSKGRIQASLTGRRDSGDEHTLTVGEQADGAIRFLCGSQYDETFTGSDGEVATLTVNIADNMKEGDYSIILKNIKLTETDISKYYEMAEKRTTLTIVSYKPGDINGDTKVDVSDYIGIANRIMGNTPTGFIERAGDVDNNGTIDVSDYIGVANIIMTGSIYGSSNSRSFSEARGVRKAITDVDKLSNVIYIPTVTVDKGTASAQLSLHMKNSAKIRGFQFDLYLPDGITAAKNNKGRIQAQLSKSRLEADDEHTLTVGEQSDGAIRFLCGSQYDETFNGSDGEVITLTVNIANNLAPGDYPILLTNIKLTETDISKYYETESVESSLTIVGVPPVDDMAAITFVAGKKERSIAIGLNVAGKVRVDWGDGKIVEQEATAAYDGWDNLLEFTGMPSGTVKIYADGVTYFQSFTKYDAGATTISGGISSIDLSNVGATLEELDIHQNNLKSVDLSKLTALTTLSIGVNDFTTINLSANTALTKLDISSGMNDGKLSAIDLSKNTRLTNIVLSGNQLTALDLSHNTLAKTVTVVNNQLSNVIFGANTATKHTINLGGNRLTMVDLSRFADASGTYLRLRDNDLTEVKLPVKISQLWVDGNAFTLAQLYALKNMAKTFTYATTYSKAEAQAPMSINADDGRVDLASQAILGQTATMFTWKDATGSSLTQGIDYTESNGVFTFLKPFSGIRCEMTNSELTGLTVKTMPVTVTAASGSSTAKLSIRDFRIKRGYRADMIIELSNPEDEITSVQFDLRLPEGLSIKQTDGEYVIDIAGRTSWRKHTLDANATDGIVRFLLASISNAPLSGTSGAIIKVTLVADDHYNWSDVSLENILLTTTDGRQLSTEDVTYYLRTGINSVTAEEKDAEVFSLSGQRVLAPKKGINIIDRKKVVVK